MDRKIAIFFNEGCAEKADALSKKLHLPIADNPAQWDLLLVVSPDYIELKSNQLTKAKPIRVDFVEGVLAHRREYGGGKNQLLGKAVGLQRCSNPTVVDATAGLGCDGFILATLGCRVTLCERSPIIAALLEDGILRAKVSGLLNDLTLHLWQEDAITYLKKLPEKPDVIYCDPMYPERVKTALAKKEMRILREVVGDDEDVINLFNAALKYAKKRVVVKRPRLAPSLTDLKPSIVFAGKSTRFDVYLTSLIQ